MDINDQSLYWDSVAQIKTFTHPLDTGLLSKYIKNTDKILDYGCGYGRLVEQLAGSGYTNIVGFDTSKELVKRGLENAPLPIFHIHDLSEMNIAGNSVDCVLLFAVLTCMPSNKAQQELMDCLYEKIKPGGIIYISDYYLQGNLNEVSRYEYLNGDSDNFGIFSLPEGAVFRHHTQEWVTRLTKGFTIKEHLMIDVQTMNGNKAKAFQLIGQK